MDSIMKRKLYDVLVVGAGPSGTTAARQCALRGLDTLLIEKKEFPRYKPCAGGVARLALSSLDFEVPQDIVERECFGLRFLFRGCSAEASKPHRIGILVSRQTFDTFLLEKAREAGSDVLLATEARDFQVSPDHAEVATGKGSLRARCLVIAEGAMGRLATRIRGPFGKKGSALTMVTEIEGSQEDIDRRTQGRFQIHFDVAHRGYGWIFPHRGYYSIGIGGLRNRMKNPRGLMREFLTKQGFDARQRVRGHLIPIGGIRRKLVSDRVVLVGDAAGFVDAFAGEGITYAILSGKLAAETIHAALTQGSLSTIDLTAFQQKCNAHFGARLRDAYYMARILHTLPAVFLKTLASQPGAVENLLNVAEWNTSYREFLIWFLARIPRYLL